MLRRRAALSPASGFLRCLLPLMLLSACAADGLPAPFEGPPRSLPTRIWRSEGAPQIVLLALHGFNDHKGAFELFARNLAKRGVYVEAYDQRGFGENPDRGRFPGAERLAGDLRARLLDLRQRFPDRPLFVLGESMGAAVAVVALAGPDAPPVAGVILSAPAVWGGPTLNPLYRILLWVAARLAPGLEVTGESLGRRASDNLEVLHALARDPLFIRKTRLAAVAGLVDLMDRAFEAAPALRLRTLVLVGRRDEIVPPRAQLAFARRLGAEDCRLVLYPEGWHLLLRDLQRARVYRDIRAWLAHEPLASGLDRPCRQGGAPASSPGAKIARKSRRASPLAHSMKRWSSRNRSARKAAAVWSSATGHRPAYPAIFSGRRAGAR